MDGAAGTARGGIPDDRASERGMDQYLRSIGLHRKKIAKDGSCLFRAVAEQVMDSQMLHTQVRNKCAEFLKENRESYEAFVEGDFEEYLIKLRDPQQWVGEVEINALAVMYKRDFIIFQEPGKPPVHITDNGFKDKVQLCFLNGNHYDSVYPISRMKSAAVCQSILYDWLYEHVLEVDRATMGQCNRIPRSQDLLNDDAMDPCASSDDSDHEEDHQPQWLGNGGSTTAPRHSRSYRGRGAVRPYLSERVRRSLNPTLFRNVEYDVWDRNQRAQQKLDFCIAAGMHFSTGDRCQVRLDNGGRYFNATIKEVMPGNGPVTVYIEELNRKHTVPLFNLSPLGDDSSWKTVVATRDNRRLSNGHTSEWGEGRGRGGRMKPTGSLSPSSSVSLATGQGSTGRVQKQHSWPPQSSIQEQHTGSHNNRSYAVLPEDDIDLEILLTDEQCFPALVTQSQGDGGKRRVEKKNRRNTKSPVDNLKPPSPSGGERPKSSTPPLTATPATTTTSSTTAAPKDKTTPSTTTTATGDKTTPFTTAATKDTAAPTPADVNSASAYASLAHMTATTRTGVIKTSAPSHAAAAATTGGAPNPPSAFAAAALASATSASSYASVTSSNAPYPAFPHSALPSAVASAAPQPTFIAPIVPPPAFLTQTTPPLSSSSHTHPPLHPPSSDHSRLSLQTQISHHQPSVSHPSDVHPSVSEPQSTVTHSQSPASYPHPSMSHPSHPQPSVSHPQPPPDSRSSHLHPSVSYTQHSVSHPSHTQPPDSQSSHPQSSVSYTQHSVSHPSHTQPPDSQSSHSQSSVSYTQHSVSHTQPHDTRTSHPQSSVAHPQPSVSHLSHPQPSMSQPQPHPQSSVAHPQPSMSHLSHPQSSMSLPSHSQHPDSHASHPQPSVSLHSDAQPPHSHLSHSQPPAIHPSHPQASASQQSHPQAPVSHPSHPQAPVSHAPHFQPSVSHHFHPQTQFQTEPQQALTPPPHQYPPHPHAHARVPSVPTGAVPLHQLSQLYMDPLFPGFPVGEKGEALQTAPPYSMSFNGSDLPRDVNILRFFFNLGLKAYSNPMFSPYMYLLPLQQAYTMQPTLPHLYPPPPTSRDPSPLPPPSPLYSTSPAPTISPQYDHFTPPPPPHDPNPPPPVAAPSQWHHQQQHLGGARQFSSYSAVGYPSAATPPYPHAHSPTSQYLYTPSLPQYPTSPLGYPPEFPGGQGPAEQPRPTDRDLLQGLAPRQSPGFADASVANANGSAASAMTTNGENKDGKRVSPVDPLNLVTFVSDSSHPPRGFGKYAEVTVAADAHGEVVDLNCFAPPFQPAAARPTSHYAAAAAFGGGGHLAGAEPVVRGTTPLSVGCSTEDEPQEDEEEEVEEGEEVERAADPMSHRGNWRYSSRFRDGGERGGRGRGGMERGGRGSFRRRRGGEGGEGSEERREYRERRRGGENYMYNYNPSYRGYGWPGGRGRGF